MHIPAIFRRSHVANGKTSQDKSRDQSSWRKGGIINYITISWLYLIYSRFVILSQKSFATQNTALHALMGDWGLTMVKSYLRNNCRAVLVTCVPKEKKRERKKEKTPGSEYHSTHLNEYLIKLHHGDWLSEAGILAISESQVRDAVHDL